MSSVDVGQLCVDTVNRYRAMRSMPPLARWRDAEECAASEAADDARAQQAHSSFGRCKEWAQNGCPNWAGSPAAVTDECLRAMWDEGPGDPSEHGHYNNMVSPRWTKVACGTFTMPNGLLWAVQIYQ